MPEIVASPPLFPSFVAQQTITFDPRAASDGDADLAARFPGVALPATLARSSPERRVEYAAGRFSARAAVRTCAPEHAAASVGSGPHGEPLWPDGIVGTITHARGLASAAVARARDTRAVGLDVEPAGQDLSGDAIEHVALPGEVSALARTTGWSTASAALVAFSAKETVFKCLFPEVGRSFDFHDVAIEAIDPAEGPAEGLAQGRFEARLLVPLAPRLAAGARLEGRFARNGEWIFTAMWLPP